jgi:hypothetical protein
MSLVVSILFLTPRIGRINRPSHGVGHFIGVHNHFAINVPGSSANGLG